MEYRASEYLTLWPGRYARIPGRSSAFHVVSDRGARRIAAKWYRDEAWLTCHMVPSSAAAHLADVVVQAKRWLGGAPGGAFQINEFGQVLVPSSVKKGALVRAYVGEVSGTMEFEDPLEGGTFKLRRQRERLQSGSPWPLPYIGMRYNLSKRSRLYFWHEDADGGRAVEPPAQDVELIGRIREHRRSGAVRFIVTAHGDVVTKQPAPGAWSSEETWAPIYIGAINPELWFTKECAG